MLYFPRVPVKEGDIVVYNTAKYIDLRMGIVIESSSKSRISVLPVLKRIANEEYYVNPYSKLVTTYIVLKSFKDINWYKDQVRLKKEIDEIFNNYINANRLKW